MSFTHSCTKSVSVDGKVVSSVLSYTGSQNVSIDETIAANATDFLINIAIDVSATKSFIIKSDAAMTIETNDGTSPDNTLSLIANDAYVWNTNSLSVFKLTTDVTKIYVTSVAGGNLRIECLQDASP